MTIYTSGVQLGSRSSGGIYVAGAALGDIPIVETSYEGDDDFEGYSLGDLVGQGDWVQYQNRASAQVVDSPTYDGNRAVKIEDLRGAKLPITESVGSSFHISVYAYLDTIGGLDISEFWPIWVDDGSDDDVHSLQFGHRGQFSDSYWTVNDGEGRWATDSPLIMDEWVLLEVIVEPSLITWRVDGETIEISENPGVVDPQAYSVYADDGDIGYVDAMTWESGISGAIYTSNVRLR